MYDSIIIRNFGISERALRYKMVETYVSNHKSHLNVLYGRDVDGYWYISLFNECMGSIGGILKYPSRHTKKDIQDEATKHLSRITNIYNIEFIKIK